mgnify:CR=1 FL=1
MIEKFWLRLSQKFRQMEPCEQGWRVLNHPAALVQHLQGCLPCRKLRAAQYLAHKTASYLRMERTPTGLQARLYVSPVLPGYVQLELPAILPQVYAAGNVYQGQVWTQQAVSEDDRLLVTLRVRGGSGGELTARYLPNAYWQLDESGIVRSVPQTEDALEPPESLACLIIDYIEGSVQARIGAWFVQEGEAYVARLRLPLERTAHTPSRIEVGLIPARALRWLTPEELVLSQQCALQAEARARWDSWRADYAR